MSLQSALKLLIEEYPQAVLQEFKGNAVAGFIRSEIPNYVSNAIKNDPRYICEGSPGKGNWANVPWIAVMDRFITETVQDGYYVVYLVKEDFQGIYLSLNQGVTTIEKEYRSEAKKALKIRAKDYLARIGSISNKYIEGEINLSVSAKSKLGSLYEAGAICSIYYPVENIPNDDSLSADLNSILEVYSLLSEKETQLVANTEEEDDEQALEYENLKNIRSHKRIERNKKLANKVKKIKGHICEVCDFNFESHYGELGKGYIEAHHLMPIHKLKGEKIALDPVKDFAVLCANCHRMIHRSEFVSDVEKFRSRYLKR